MRRWVVDKLRLVARWALKRWMTRVMLFACMPTRKELDQIFAAAMPAIRAAIANQAPTDDRPRQDTTLH